MRRFGGGRFRRAGGPGDRSGIRLEVAFDRLHGVVMAAWTLAKSSMPLGPGRGGIAAPTVWTVMRFQSSMALASAVAGPGQKSENHK